MRLPGRLHITWQDDRTLSVETDAGTQVRTLRSAGAGRRRRLAGELAGIVGSRPARWVQGFSSAAAGCVGNAGRSFKVVTTGMKPGYLRKNGVPYSADAVITEYFDRFDLPGGDTLLVVSTEVVDPTYLAQPFWTSTHFKHQRDATGWKPTPCRPDDPAHRAAARRRALTVAVARCVLAVIDVRGQAPAPAPAPGFDLSGYWSPALHEDSMDRGAGPEIGDYGGIPINEAGRLFALSYDPSRLTLRHHQCDGYVAPYQMRALGNARAWEERDPQTHRLIAIHWFSQTFEGKRTIWMDGRPHPPA